MIKLGHIDGGFRKCVGDKIEVLVTGLVIESVTPSISDWLYVIYHHDKFCHPHPKIDANFNLPTSRCHQYFDRELNFLQEIRSKISVALSIAYK